MIELPTVRSALALLLSIGMASALPAQHAPEAVAAGQPLRFLPNLGQWREGVLYAAENGASRQWIDADGLWLCAHTPQDLGACIQFAFEGADWNPADARVEGPAGPLSHWLRGDLQVSSVPSHSRLVLEGLYGGTDLVLRAGGEGQDQGYLEYDLVLAAKGDLTKVSIRVDGHTRLRLLPSGELSIGTAIGDLLQSPPVTWVTQADGSRSYLPSRFVLRGQDRFGFEVDGWDGGELTIDPGLVWGTFLGGSGTDAIECVGVDSQGRTIVAGTTDSTDFPTTPGAYRPSRTGGTDGFVAAFDSGGRQLWTTYFGGTLDEEVDDLKILSGDRVAIGGSTSSFNFPVSANRFQAQLFNSPAADAFGMILPASGASIEYSTYLGGIGDQRAVHIDVDSTGDIHFAGITAGTIPTTANNVQGINGGMRDAFYVVLNRQQPGSTSLRYGTYFGGVDDEERIDSLSVDAMGVATIGVTTRSTSMPTTSTAWQSGMVGGPVAGYILCLQGTPGVTSAMAFVYGSYFGESGGSTERLMVEVDSAGFFLCVATTSSPNWVTSPISAQPAYGGGASDGLVARFDPGSTSALLIATYAGGSGAEVVHDARFDFNVSSTEVASIVGATTSTDLPLSNSPLQASPNGTGRSAFVQQINFRAPGPLMLQYSSYFDSCGAGDDALHAVDVDGGEIVVAGATTGAVAPGTGSFQVSSAGGQEGILARLDGAAQPSLYATSGQGCGQPGAVPVFDVTTAQLPRMCQAFSTNVNNLYAGNVGMMVMGLSNQLWSGIPLPFPLDGQGMPGCSLQVSLDETFLVFHGATSVAFGFPVPGSMAFYDIDLYLQFFELDPALNAAGFATSNVAELNIQF
jgi:hypothetical protein